MMSGGRTPLPIIFSRRSSGGRLTISLGRFGGHAFELRRHAQTLEGFVRFAPEVEPALAFAVTQLVPGPVAKSARALGLHLYAREDRQALGEAARRVQLAAAV